MRCLSILLLSVAALAVIATPFNDDVKTTEESLIATEQVTSTTTSKGKNKKF